MVVIVTNQRKNTSWCTKGQTSTEGMSFPGTDFGPLERWVILMMMMRKIIMNMRMDQPYIGSAHVHEALSLMTMTDDTHTHTRTEMITCLTCLSSTAKSFRVALRKHCPETAETQCHLCS